MRILGRYAALGLLVSAVTGCGVVQNPFGSTDNLSVGLPFQAQLSTAEGTRRAFTVRVDAPGGLLPDIRESARYRATRHCVETYGDSRVDWLLDPATGDWAVARDAALAPIVTGACVAR